MRLTAALLLGLLLIPAGTAPAAELIGEFNVGGWWGGAYSNNKDDTGFSYCLVAKAAGGSKYVLVVRATEIGYAIGLIDTDKPFSANESFKISARVDKRWSFEGDGIAVSDQLVRLTLPSEEEPAARKALAAGNRLVIELEDGRKASASLRGSRKALARMDKCYTTRIAKVPPGPKEAPQPTTDPQPSSAPQPAPEEEVRLSDAERDWGGNPALNRRLAEATGYGGHFRDGAFGRWISRRSPELKARVGEIVQLHATLEAAQEEADRRAHEETALLQTILGTSPTPNKSDVEHLAALDGGTSLPLLEPVAIAWNGSPDPVQPTIRPKSAKVVAGEPMIAVFSGLPKNGQHWIALAAPDDGPEQYFAYYFTDATSRSGEYAFPTLPVGGYELRLYLDWPKGGYTVAASHPFTVVAP